MKNFFDAFLERFEEKRDVEIQRARVQVENNPTAQENLAAVLSKLGSFADNVADMEGMLCYCLQNTLEDVQISIMGDTIIITQQAELDPSHSAVATDLSIEITVDNRLASIAEINITTTRESLGEVVVDVLSERLDADGTLIGQEKISVEGGEIQYEGKIDVEGQTISIAEQKETFWGQEVTMKTITETTEVENVSLSSPDKNSTRTTMREIVDENTVRETVEGTEPFLMRTVVTSELSDGLVQIEKVEDRGTSYTEERYIQNGRDIIEGCKINTYSNDDVVTVHVEEYSSDNGRLIRTEATDGIIDERRICPETGGQIIMKYDYNRDTDTYEVKHTLGQRLLLVETRDRDDNVIETKTDMTRYEFVVVPEKFEQDGIERTPIYNIDNIEYNTHSLYGYEFRQDGELVGFTHFRIADDGHVGVSTTVDFRTGEVERTVIDVYTGDELEIKLDVQSAIYDRETHAITYMDNIEGATYVACGERFDVKDGHNGDGDYVRYIVFVPLSETVDEIKERLTTSGDAFPERCVKIQVNNKVIQDIKLVETDVGLKPYKAGVWASVEDRAHGEISQWSNWLKRNDRSVAGEYVSTFTIAPTAKVCLCRTFEDLCKLSTLYPIKTDTIIIHEKVSVRSLYNVDVDWGAVARDYDVLIVDTREEGGLISVYDIETSIVVFNAEAVVIFECVPIEEYVEREGFEDYDYEGVESYMFDDYCEDDGWGEWGEYGEYFECDEQDGE